MASATSPAALEVPKSERHVGAGPGQRDGHLAADPARGAGDEGDLAGDVERRRGVGAGGGDRCRSWLFAHWMKLSRNRPRGAT